MRRRSRDSRGLAEIVGTLMLVVIVVAAATAFSFFVAAYQKQVQTEETVVHDRALENLKFISLSSDGCALYDGATHSCATPLPNDEFAEVTVEVASLDINGIGVTGVYLAGHPVVNYSVVIGHSTYTPCFDSTNKTSIPCQAVALPPYAEPRFIFNLDNDTDFSAASSCGGSRVLDCLYAFGTPFDSTAISASHELVLDLLTSLGNSFVGTFVPPVAKFGVTYVDSWPILDGSGSYQPSGGVTTNASIDQWGWSVHTNSVDQDNGNYSGQQTELPAPFVPGATYFINLTVTNALGLVGTAREVYVAPG
ncbi:MAG TPA: hypothetical protein VML53_05610 [Thermoplasmata archaeon]|nr:hypothetical protein [Thermoplasmata archaeon]